MSRKRDTETANAFKMPCNNPDGICNREDCKAVGCCQISHLAAIIDETNEQPDNAPTNVKHVTRETWLTDLMQHLANSLFDPAGYNFPLNARVSCGFPSRKALITDKNNHALGQCWADEKSADGHFEIFVSPVIDNPMRVAGILAHEMVHATVGIHAKHGRNFKKCAMAVGLEGKMSATIESDLFKQQVQPLLDDTGPYPHAKLDARKMTNGVKKQSTRLHKATCPMCGYNVRITRKWLDEVGVPHCPAHGAMDTDYLEGTAAED